MPKDSQRGPSSRSTRRRVLRTAGAGLAATLAASTSGCLATMPPLGRRVRYDRVTAPAPGDPVYRRWCPDPSAFPRPPEPSRSGGVVGVMYAEPDRMVGTPVGGFPGDLLKPRLDYFGVGYDDYDRVIRFGPIVVVEADVGGSTVAETLSSNGYRSTGSYGGYELFGRTDVQRTVAVEEQRLLFSRGRESEANVTAVIDAEMSDVDRYHETDDSFATLSASVGSHPFSWLGRGTVSDQALTAGFSVTAEGDTVYYVLDELYPDGQTPSEAGFKERLNEDPRAVESAAVDVEMDGRVASATMEMSGRQYREVNGIETRSPSHPQITWGIDHLEDDGTVVIRHEAGESVDAGQVEVRFGGIQDGSLADEQFSARYDRVDPGDELRVDLDGRPAGAPLVVWHAAPDGGAALLVYDFN